MKNKKWAIVFILWIVAVATFAIVFHPDTESDAVPATKQSSFIDSKFEECINAGGQFFMMDYSLKDDGTEYKMSCEVPEHRLWRIEIK